MATKEIPFADASASQLADFASTQYGLDVRHTTGHANIIKALQAVGYDKQTIAISVPDPIAMAAQAAGRRMAEINIPEQEKPGGSEAVYVSVNGRSMFIPRGQNCTVGYEYYEALLHAVKYVYDTDENGGLINPPREVLEYPVILIRADPPLPAIEAKAA